MATPDPFLRAHADAKNAVATFLPSIGPNPPQPPPPPPHPLAKRDIMQEMTHAAAMARHVEQASAKIAMGLPPDPPQPPGPEETFGNVLDVVHTQALRNKIAEYPEEERSRLISEAHDSATKWIMSHNGKVVVHGKVMTADSPSSAEKLAAKIVNDTVEEHDQEEADEAEMAGEVPADGPTQRGAAKGGKNRKPSPRPPAASAGGNGTAGPDSAGRSGSVAPGRPVSNAPSAASGGADAGSAIPADQDGSGAVGSVDDRTGRVITHATDNLDEAQETATAAAPELEDKLQDVADAIPGVRVHGVRDRKDKDRAQRKAEADEKPINTHSDLLAGRLVVDSPEAKDAAVAQIKSTSPVIDEEDSFQQGDPDYGFRSHDVQVALGDGDTSAEVQIVPKEIADLDEDTHKTYEAGRDAEADGDTETADAAKAENKEKHDAAMDAFNERNGDKSAKLRDLLKQAGFDVTGEPIKIGGHSFVPIREQEEEDSQG